MALSPFKTWLAGEVLTASDLNSSFTQITNNGLSLVSPLTGNLDLDGHDVVGDSDGDSKFTFSTNNRFDVVLQGVTLFKFDGTVTSPFNGLSVVAGATGSAVQIQGAGGDTDVSINLVPKGAGTLQYNGTEISTVPAAQAVFLAEVFA